MNTVYVSMYIYKALSIYVHGGPEKVRTSLSRQVT